jgi:SAM-dependent methyltransferase
MADVEARLRRYVSYDEVNAPYLAWQLQQFWPYIGRRVLEVGCGVGAILAQLGDRDLVMGVDIEPELVDFTRKRFAGSSNHEFAALDISALSEPARADLKSKRFDSVVCINVLEHIEDDAAAVANMGDVLVTKGTISLLVPAHPALYGEYDRTDGHFRRYTSRTLRKVFEDAGLHVERLYHFNALGAAGWWYQYRLRRHAHQSQSDYKLMQRILPVIKAVENRVKPPFGMSLIAIARKPA